MINKHAVLAIALAASSASCSDNVQTVGCQNEVEKSPLGRSRVSVDILVVAGLDDPNLFFASQICDEGIPLGTVSLETKRVIQDAIKRGGLPYDSGINSTDMKSIKAELSIFKYGEGEREYFVTAFWE